MRCFAICRPLLLACVLLPMTSVGEDKTITPPDRRDVQTEVMSAVAKLGIKDEASLDSVTRLWQESKAGKSRDVLDLVVKTFAAVHPETSRFVDSCGYVQPSYKVPRMPKLEDAPLAYKANVGVFYGRYLAQRRMYDEALAVLKSIEPDTTVDPATLLFFKGVCQQQLLQKDEGLRTLSLLLKNTVGVPVSYRQVAQLMEYELQNLEEKSLDEVSRLMGDVGRRLDLGRGGQRVQKRETEIVARLDEIIKKLEQQQGGGGGGGAAAQGGNQNSPADAAQESRVKGTAGKGDADEKKIAGKGGWGMLDKKAETKARESIKRKFPSHYSEAIKRYNLKLAK